MTEPSMLHALAPGFIIASPALLDPNFQRTVVLLVAHNADGALGFIVNRPMTGLTIERVLKDLGAPCTRPRPDLVMAGGPVQREAGFVVLDRGEDDESLPAPPDGYQVGPRIVVSSSRAALALLGNQESTERSHLMLGYAGWGPGQLEDEIATGAWIPTDLDAALIFDAPMSERWGLAFASIGSHPALIARNVGQA